MELAQETKPKMKKKHNGTMMHQKERNQELKSMNILMTNLKENTKQQQQKMKFQKR